MGKRAQLRRTRVWLLLAGTIAVGGYLMATGHQLHLYQALPLLFLIACPLMHLFLHRHHGGRHNQGDGSRLSDS